MMKVLIVLVALLPLAFATIPRDVAAGYVPGQPNNIVIRPEHPHHGADAAFTVVDESGQFVDTSRPISELISAFSAYDVANFIAQTLGVTPLHHNTASSIFTAKTNLFSRPRANLLLTIDGLGLESVSSLKLSALSPKQLSAPYVHLSQVFYPATINNLASAISSGRAPAQMFSASPNLADAVNSAFHAQSLFVSASARSSVASSFAPRSVKTSRTMVLSIKENAFSDIASSPLDKTVAQLLSAVDAESTNTVWNFLKQNGIEVSIENDVATVTMGETSVTFDLTSTTDAAFFAELQFITSLPSSLSSRLQAAVQDDVPDVFALTISTLAEIALQHGASSSKFQTAALMVDVAVPFIIRQFSAIYPQRLVTEIVLSGSVVTEPNTQEAIAAVNTVLSENNYDEISSLDFVAGPMTPSALQPLCAAINTAVAPFHFAAYCPITSTNVVTSLAEPRFRVLDVPTTNVTDFNCYTSTDAYPSCAAYQIAMWTGIMLAVAVFAAVYGVLYMDLKRDTLLYSKFNPASNRKNQ